jgi:formylglycine-generating enzyme required for sulfatase activity
VLLVPCFVCACSASTNDVDSRVPEGWAVEISHDVEQPYGGEAVCPKDMVLVDGNYCPEAGYVCKKWMDPPGRFHEFRCAEYGPSVCASKTRKHLRFCMDRDEYTRPGDKVPTVDFSWTSAKKTCEQMGKRLCLESEWQFACEGEEMHPYPYGNGYVRDASACNIDRQGIVGKKAPVDLREPAGSHPQCVSPFGVRDMSGNVEEWATIDGATSKGFRSTMKGAWWLPGRNHCRARTIGHGEIYSGPQIGVRCCKSVP